MTWLATVSGAVIALAGTVISDRLRRRHEVERDVHSRSRDLYVAFILAAGTCHSGLRRLAQAPVGEISPAADARRVFADSGIYEARERLFIDGSRLIAGLGQDLFERLKQVRSAVAGGAHWDSDEFHRHYHPYLDAVWRYRTGVRTELGSTPLTPDVFGWVSLDGSATCPVCGSTDAS